MITLEIARQHLKLPTTLDEANFCPYIPDAIERYLRPFLGETLIALLWSKFTGSLEQEDDERLTALMNYVSAPLSRFTFLVAAPSLDINVGQAGFTTAGGGNMVPASEGRVNRFTASIERLGWDGVETLLRFLVENKKDYEEWTDSDAYKVFTQNFIRSAVLFNAHVDIDASYLKFYRLNQKMMMVETLQIEPLLGTELYQALKAESIEGTNVNVVRVKAIDLTCKAIAMLTMVQDGVEAYRLPSGHVYNMLRDHINAHPDDFPEKFPEGSQTTRAPYSNYENTEDNAFFVFGG